MILSPHELHFTAIRAQGPGGQNVNKVSCAVHLRFDIRASSLPEAVKERLLQSPDQRVSRDGVIVIKAQASRSLEQNKLEAVARAAGAGGRCRAGAAAAQGDEADARLAAPPARGQVAARRGQGRARQGRLVSGRAGRAGGRAALGCRHNAAHES